MKIKFLITLLVPFFITSSAFAQSGGAQMMERFVEGFNCEEYLLRMDNVVSQAQNNPNSTIYFYVYEGKTRRHKYKKDGSYTTETVLPQKGLAKARIRSMKQYAANFRRFDIKRFVFVEAGPRDEAAVEIWNVPAGAVAPSPSPTVKKIRYRKGKPEGFCLGCCG